MLLKADSSHALQPDGSVIILVEQLKPNTSWTLSVYQVNRHGQSPASVAVVVRTQGAILDAQ